MIKIVKGDLLQATENIIGHQVNCQAKMNSGVAKAVRQNHLLAYNMYMSMVKRYVDADLRKELLGKCQVVNVGADKYVANLFGQYNYGYDGAKYTNELALYESFKSLRELAEQTGLSVALPYLLGCERGGADWTVVEGYLLKAFEGYEVTLYKLDMG